MYFTFYDKSGIPIAYSDDNDHIFLFSGESVAYLYGESVYGYNGRHLGFFIDGWIRDHHGDCVFFTDIAKGPGPVKPVKRVKPVKSVKSILPVKSVREVKPIKPITNLLWSNLSGKQFFYQ